MSSLTLCSLLADKGRGRKDVASRRGFTLIELLIVIAIILILISIALPNFLEAQMRAKVVKVKGEIRSLALALEQYYLDFKIYPPENEADTTVRGRTSQGLFWLSSPIKYMSRIPEDPFCARDSPDDKSMYYETGGIKTGKAPCFMCLATWALYTRGPDLGEDIKSAAPHCELPSDGSVDSYSPTNGTRSGGDIFQYGGDPRWIGVNALNAKGDPNSYAKIPLIVDWQPYLQRMPPKLR